MKVVSIVGARPQFIKAAMLSGKLRQHGQEMLVHTGQHYDGNMSDVFFRELDIPRPDIYLGIGGGTHAEQTGRMMIEIERILANHKPDWCVVYGDTNSTLAAALAAAKLRIRVAHVEAGLRSFNKAMPEEINRILTDHVSSALFCPAQTAADHLFREGIIKGVHVVGDVMADVLYRSVELIPQDGGIVAQLNLQPKSYALVTIHRASNTDSAEILVALIDTLGRLGLPTVFPVHPRTRKMIQNYDIRLPSSIRAIEPVSYLDMLQLQRNADCILTDSGGMQKEAYWMGVRCITLRDETEWTETVDAGWNCIVGTDSERIIEAVLTWRPDGCRPELYGNGHAVDKIANLLSG